MQTLSPLKDRRVTTAPRLAYGLKLRPLIEQGAAMPLPERTSPPVTPPLCPRLCALPDTPPLCRA